LRVGRSFLQKKSFLEEFDKQNLIYLSPESPNVLLEIDPGKIFIIGGIVDHNRLKGLSYKTASEKGIYSARLPIEEYFGETIPNSLNSNHVFQILMDMAIHKDWEKVLKMHVPGRYLKSKEKPESTKIQKSKREKSEVKKSTSTHPEASTENQDSNGTSASENAIPNAHLETKASEKEFLDNFEHKEDEE